MNSIKKLLFSVIVPCLILIGNSAHAVEGGAGELDIGFNPIVAGVPGDAYGVGVVAQQADGKIIIGGDFISVNGATHNYIARLNSDGTVDNGFNVSLDGTVDTIFIQADGKIIIKGAFISVNGAAHASIARLNINGSLDDSFSSPIVNPAGAPIYAAVQQVDGKIILLGEFSTVNGVARNHIARLNPDGSIDSGFNPDIYGYPTRAVQQADGKIIIGGDFTIVNGISRTGIARLNADGSLDSGFSLNLWGESHHTVVQQDGKIILAGSLTKVNGILCGVIARINPDSSLDSSFNMSANDIVSTALLQLDGKVVITGDFTIVNGEPRTRIARLNADGSLDTDFSPSIVIVDGGLGSALQADGKVIIFGEITSVNGVPRTGIARLYGGGIPDTDGDGVDDNVDAFPSNASASVDTDKDGKPDSCVGSCTGGLVLDNDDDGDGVADTADAFPLDPTETVDTDGDGIGDNSDPTPNGEPPLGNVLGNIIGDKTGASVAFAGDFNNDGYGDYIIGIPGFDQSAKDAGRAEVISGKNGSVLSSLNGAAAKDALGTAVAGNADIDNDGYDDVVIGAPNAGATHAGSITILYGPDGAIPQIINGTVAKSGFGSAVALGDVNGDNRADILVGAPKDDDVTNRLTDSGSVTVLSGNGFGQLQKFYGASAKANAGTSVASGDINNDGNADIIIGALNDNGTGSVKVFNIAGTILLQATGATSKAQLGKAVASGDVNNDGFADVLVGAPGDDSGALKDAGSITVFSGNGGTPLTKKYGAVAKSGLGNSVAAGDVDGDGKADIIAGASKDDKPAAKVIKDAGSVSVFSGNGYTPIGGTFYGDLTKDYFGFAVSAGDINSDGKDDIIIGIPGFDVLATKPVKDAGAVRVLSGAGL